MPHKTTTTTGYDAFLSYSQAVSGELATALQSWLERFATPWYRPRSLRIFRDFTSLSASEDLWQTIKDGLSSSSHFILLASPEAARSPWVNREVEWWRANRSCGDMFIVLTGGALRWDAQRNDWDWQRTTSLPPAARGMFGREPLWVDLSSVRTVRELDRSNPVLLNSVAQIAAPLRGVDKDKLVGEHITYYRRARRQRRGGVVALSVLTVFAVAAAYIARVQANDATAQARIATSRVLAEAALGNTGTNLSLAQLLAAEAYQLNPDTVTRSALFQAVTASPALVRYLNAGSTVSGLAGSGNGHYIVAGTGDGQVVRWTVAGFSKLVITHLGHAVSSVSVSRDGDTVAAADGAKAVVWTSRSGVRSVDVPHGQQAYLSAVSPSGRFVLVYSTATPTGYSAVPSTLILADTQTGQVNRANVSGVFPATGVVLPSDQVAVMLSEYGNWRRFTVPAMAPAGHGGADFGIKDYAVALSPDGGLITSSNGASVIPIWKTQPTSISPYAGDYQAASTGPYPEAIAISPDDHAAATAANGSLYVAPITRSGTKVVPARQLSGNAAINSGALAFVGDSSHLVSGSGPLVAFWNLNQLSRIGTQVDTAVPWECADCPAAWLSFSPDDKIAILSSGTATAQQVGHPSSSHQEFAASDEASYGPAAWSPDGRRLFIATSAGIEVRGSSPGLPILTEWPNLTSDNPMAAISASSDGKHVITVDTAGIIDVWNAATGNIVKTVQSPGEGSAVLQARTGAAAVSADGTTVAILASQRSIDLVDLLTGKISPVSVPTPYSVEFGGNYLAVQSISTGSGDVRLWDLAHHDWVQSGAGGDNTNSFSINSTGTMLADYEFNDSVLLQDPGTGATIGSFDVASPAVGLPPPSLTFSNDGTQLVVAVQGDSDIHGFNGKLEDWNLSANAWLRAACTAAGVPMTSAEWREFVGSQGPATLACARG